MQLFEQNLEWAAKVARSVARKLPPSFDISDLEQEARLETWKRAQSYDPANTKGTPFQAYAYLAVRGAVLMACRRRAWKAGTAEAISKSEVSDAPRPDELIQSQQEDEADREKRAQQRAWLLREIRKLPPVAAYLMRRVYIDGADVGELASILGVERTALSRRVQSLCDFGFAERATCVQGRPSYFPSGNSCTFRHGGITSPLLCFLNPSSFTGAESARAVSIICVIHA